MKGMQFNTALVVYNKPLYQLHILEKKDRFYQNLLKKRHPTTKTWKSVYEQHHRTLEGIQRTLNLLGIKTDLLYRKKVKKVGVYDLVVTVGGDGTFLEVSHFLNQQLLLGVNAAPVESTGALCRARLDNFLSLLIDLLTGERKPIKVSRLKAKIDRRTLPDPALNEILFANTSPAGTSRYEIKINPKKEEQKSSGVWISTATGSTAAIRSSGGKALPLDYQGMQFTIRELFPEPGKKFKLVQGLLPKTKKIVLISKMRQSALYIDGNHIEVPVAYGEKIEISPTAKPLWAVL